MNETRYQPVTPEERDNMPFDVALELLTNPRNRLSARVRKNCMDAREKVFVSKHPIRHDPNSPAYLVWDTDIVQTPAKDKLERKLLIMPWARLNRVIKRMDTRIARVRSALLRAEKKIVVPWISNTLRNNLESKISAMETTKQIAINITNHRKSLWKTNQ
jgi:hypothetical protein